MGIGCSSHAGTEKMFLLPIVATALIFLIELVGGLWVNSLALISDSAHVFMDVFALALSWGAIKIANMPANDTKTFGYHRVEIFSAFINGISLAAIAIVIFHEALKRFLNPEPVKSVELLVIAMAGMLVNIGVAYYLRKINVRDLNLKSAFYHVIGDTLASAGVIVGAIIIYYTGYFTVDALISFLIGIIIFAGAIRIIKESSHILLEGVPKEINVKNVVRSLKKIEGVLDVHGIHIWSICSNVFSMSAHVFVKDQTLSCGNIILREINRVLNEEYHISNPTIQFENEKCIDNSLFRKLSH